MRRREYNNGTLNLSYFLEEGDEQRGEDRMAYYRPNTVSEIKTIEIRFPEGPDIYDFKILCIRLAHSLGYSPDSIREAFGEVKHPNEDKLQEILKNLAEEN